MHPRQASCLDEGAAREHLVRLRWPRVVTCPRCSSARVRRPGVGARRPDDFRCRDCQRPFHVATGTFFEGSHVPLRHWVHAISIACHTERGVSALELQSRLGLTSYRTAWRMAHQIQALHGQLGPLPGPPMENDG